MVRLRELKPPLIKLLLLLWGLQLIWLVWYFGPDGGELAFRVTRNQVGPAVRQADPFYCWLTALVAVIPPKATYLFVDDYEAGKEIEARYHLVPRRHILLSPKAPPSFLFQALRQEQATFLVVRFGDQPPGLSVQAAASSPAFHPVIVPGPGKVFQVDFKRLLGGFYD